MTRQTGGEKITIQILPITSRSNCNQTIIFVQLTGFNNRNVFLQKLC